MARIAVVILLLAIGVKSHPQCLDFRPPFKPSTKLGFCTDYSSYGCCTTSKDTRIKRWYEHTTRKHANFFTCFPYLKDLRCLECHPYAAHVFDAETFTLSSSLFKKRSVRFPGLCKEFCLQYFDRCKPIIEELANTDEFASFIRNSTQNDFCKWATIEETKYCYPKLKSGGKHTVAPVDSGLTLCVETLPFTFSNPLVGVHAGDGSHRLFIGEQRGTVFIIDANNKKLPTPFLNITDRVLNSGNAWDERGFLCLVFHPKFKQNGRFFVFYSAVGSKNHTKRRSRRDHRKGDVVRVSEFVVDGNDPNVANRTSELVLLEVNQPEANHNGGMLMFGVDGYLYISLGDGGGSGDDHWKIGNSLNMSTLLGKMLRINVDSEDYLYTIPKDNPFYSAAYALPEIYALGLRNAWRCSIDRGDDGKKSTMFCGDVGQNKEEEIDIIHKGGNYGWRAYEGFSCYDENLCKKPYRNLNPPILSYNHSIGQSIVGGYVYQGCSNPQLRGKYIFGDTMNGQLFYAQRKNVEEWEWKFAQTGNQSICNNGVTGYYFQNILSFAEDEQRELYMLATAFPHPLSSNGRVYKLVDPFRRGDPETCNVKAQRPSALGAIKRRRVYSKPSPWWCVDKYKRTCKTFFLPKNGRPAPRDCAKSEFAKKYCLYTCDFC